MLGWEPIFEMEALGKRQCRPTYNYDARPLQKWFSGLAFQKRLIRKQI